VVTRKPPPMPRLRYPSRSGPSFALEAFALGGLDLVLVMFYSVEDKLRSLGQP
jgi:hypothetical protein